MSRLIEIHKSFTEHLARLPLPMQVAYVASKVAFGLGLGIIISRCFQVDHTVLWGCLLMAVALILTIMRMKKLLNPALPRVCILWRFLLWSSLGLAVIAAPNVPGIKCTHGWLLVAISIVVGGPSLVELIKG